MLWSFKGTLMQIWKSPYMFAFISKQYPKNFALLTLIVLFLNVCKQTFRIISRAHISKSKRCFNVKSSTYYFYIKTRISADFQIWISVPLKFLCRTILPISWIYLQMIFLVFVYYCQVCKSYWYVKTHSFYIIPLKEGPVDSLIEYSGEICLKIFIVEFTKVGDCYDLFVINI